MGQRNVLQELHIPINPGSAVNHVPLGDGINLGLQITDVAKAQVQSGVQKS